MSILLASCHSSDKLFTSLSSSKTNIEFANNLQDKSFFGILNYIYYYNGGGVAVGDINNDGLPDIYFTANSKGNNKLYLNKGDFVFEDITEKAGVAGTADWCTGVTMADVNGDGFLDIYVCAVATIHGFKGRNQLFVNNGKGGFTEAATEYGLDFSGTSTQAVFFDYDHDGDLDCYLLNQSEHPNQNIVDTSSRRKVDAIAGDRLYRNDLVNGKRKFTDVSAQAGIYQSNLGYGLGIAVADFNNDGWDDIYVGNDFHENDYYYVNNGDGTFSESGAKHFRHYSRYSMGNDAADYNNDGQIDIFTADMLPSDEKVLKTYGNGEHLDIYNQKITHNGYQNQYSKNCLQRNNGDGVSFSDVGLINGVSATDWSWSALFADFDNDGKKDLFISSGIVKRPLDLDFIMFMSNTNPRDVNSNEKYAELIQKMPDGASHPYLYKGDGNYKFNDVSENWGTGNMSGYFNGAAYADLNNDGREDLVINCINAPAVILKNNSIPESYLSIVFKGGGMNTSGIGAKAYVFANGKMQYQQLMLTRGFMSSSEPKLHFGLDSASKIDSLLIVWPDQKYQILKDVGVNRQLSVKQSDATQQFSYHTFFPGSLQSFEDITKPVNVNWKHIEDNFTDFNTQYLIPHMQSTRGPKLAVADVNKDGLDDFFVCGAKGQPGCLMIQAKDGKFINTDSALFAKNKASEDVDAVFFDANNDGFPDLYVVTGGNEYEDGNANLADHLYYNDLHGGFTEAVNALPPILSNKSCIAVADVNKDGKPDVFIGGLADAKKYGYAQSSYLLMNDVKAPGTFKKADESMLALKDIGIVTCATFTDINNDGWPDLIVSGEWMPMKIFINNKGVFKAADIPQSTGLWQSVFATDINSDGFTDILAGNWGHNSKLYAGKAGPLKLYVKDFDQNGSVDQVMTYNIAGREYPFLAKDQLELDMPVLKKRHLLYGEVAGKSAQFMLGDMMDDAKELTAETLGSACFLNDGKGNFRKTDLPEELQLAPLFAFARVDSSAWFTAGNFYGVLPYEGRYDAMLPAVFSYDKVHQQYDVISVFPAISGEVRDAKWLKYGNEKLLVVARNNDSLIFLRPLKK
ncbi:VCBS repeat-containing protein [Danxiaibacter flavus]|uniref:VCBS repeat-containing protein n=1 Tax=Danxiaibacter flavus TaxID=3049108 RepID=A0ABV3ZIF4_9BACT|nr:VCBS repeat-containing protein [Chitinophagaceae bacterium DXS]